MLTLSRKTNPLYSTNHAGELARFMHNVFDGFDHDSLDSGTISPPVDIREDGDSVVLLADLPGVDRDSIDVSVENRTLTLSGERRHEEKHENGASYRLERSYGKFVRSFALPTTVDTQNITAEFKDGVLRVELPKAVEAKPRRIEVKAN